MSSPWLQQRHPQRGGDPRHGDQRGTHIKRLFRLVPSILFCFDGDQAVMRQAAWRARSRCCRTCRTASACASCSSPRARTRQPGTRRGGRRTPSAHASPSRPAAGGVLLPATDGGRPYHPWKAKAHLATLTPRRCWRRFPDNLGLLMRQRLSGITGLSGENIGQLAHHSPAAVVHGSRSEAAPGRRRPISPPAPTTRTGPPMRRSTLRQAMARRQPPQELEQGREALGRPRSGMARRSGTKAAAATSGSATNAGKRGSPPPSTPCAPCCIIRS